MSIGLVSRANLFSLFPWLKNLSIPEGITIGLIYGETKTGDNPVDFFVDLANIACEYTQGWLISQEGQVIATGKVEPVIGEFITQNSATPGNFILELIPPDELPPIGFLVYIDSPEDEPFMTHLVIYPLHSR